jgi:hypothetical protein
VRFVRQVRSTLPPREKGENKTRRSGEYARCFGGMEANGRSAVENRDQNQQIIAALHRIAAPVTW